MGDWRNSILKEFPIEPFDLTVVLDPDGLLTEERLSIEIQSRKYHLIDFNDSIEFRFAYESNYRQFDSQQKEAKPSIVVRLQDSDSDRLPYDLIQRGRKLSFSLGDLFPDLSYPVIEKLEKIHLDDLFNAQIDYSPGRLGDYATKDFILRHVFRIASELINDEKDLLRMLLRTHYNDLQLPDILTDHLLNFLCKNKKLSLWPLDKIIHDKDYFYTFLQERWPFYLKDRKIAEDVREASPKYGLRFDGPENLPFEHEDIRVYIDNLFVEQKLKPISVRLSDSGSELIKKESWIGSGILGSESSDDSDRIKKLIDLIDNNKPLEDSRFTEWLSFALKWAELSALVFTNSDNSFDERYNCLGNDINEIFLNWLSLHYSSLMTLPPTIPAMLHQVSRRLARNVEESGNSKIVLLVVDGLSLNQWVSIRNIINDQIEGIVFKESSTFAWIPTLTSVSRQSIFSGSAPQFFPNSINSTNSEAKLWSVFWEKHQFSKQEVSYCRGLGDGDPIDALEEVFNPGYTKILGLVIDKVDKIMHGMQLGSGGMHSQIKQWCEQEYLSKLLKYLLDNNFQVWLTSDHGNIECSGVGNPLEGSIAKSRGERARVYPSPELRVKMKNENQDSFEWQPIGLPSNYFPLLANNRSAFVKKGSNLVGHGGASIEEVIVPLIKIERSI